MFLENLETLKRKIVVSKISTQFEIFIENVKKKKWTIPNVDSKILTEKKKLIDFHVTNDDRFV